VIRLAGIEERALSIIRFLAGDRTCGLRGTGPVNCGEYGLLVIGQLLAAPPAKGELKAAIERLAGRIWQHPTTGEPVRFGFSTIEHWYYRALKERTDPVGVLRRKVRANAGRQHAISDAVRQVVLAQYAAHKSWSVQLHHDNLPPPSRGEAGRLKYPVYAGIQFALVLSYL
jgi:putative transposase